MRPSEIHSIKMANKYKKKVKTNIFDHSNWLILLRDTYHYNALSSMCECIWFYYKLMEAHKHHIYLLTSIQKIPKIFCIHFCFNKENFWHLVVRYSLKTKQKECLDRTFSYLSDFFW